jgi:polysaccharide export outer membrane protein
MSKTFALLVALVVVCARPAMAQETAAGEQAPAPVDSSNLSVASLGGGATIFPGDSVRVFIWKEDTLSGTFQVDENGVLTLPLLGPLTVTSLTVEQLRSQLIRDYGAQLKNPSIDVSVKRRVSVLGQVQKPGVYTVDPTMKLSDLVALAGGLGEDGTTKNIDVMRGNTVIYDNVDASTPAVPNMHSGDMVVVNKKPWLSRNGKELLGFGLATATVIARFTIWSD